MPSIRVLVVDDNSMIRRTVCDLLESQPGFEVIGEAGDGQEAIKKAGDLRPNLVVMDLAMPVMTGIEAAHILKHTMPGVLVILFSAFMDPQVEESARGAGIDAVVSKGEGITHLVRTARHLIRA